MKCIINNMLYDTEKATEIISYREKVAHKTAFYTFYPYHHAKLFKTNKNAYLKYIGADVRQEYRNYESLEVITENQVKNILIKLNAVDKYIELFGDVEER